MSEKQRLNRKEIEELASNALIASGALETSAKSLAKAVASAEMDGIKSHGLVYVPIYCEHLLCGKVVGSAVPKVERPAKGTVVVDACSGFAHPAIDAGFSDLDRKILRRWQDEQIRCRRPPPQFLWQAFRLLEPRNRPLFHKAGVHNRSAHTPNHDF